ncbi:Vacuolar protein sorting-associated protein 11-like protein [Morus notabilis]|uniref:Vacuolar protein sorting-associated protein 11 homolog n=1 Tax=Morus notabilis TaxID=981085 RepID=W9SLZ6_9ROSA|nr:Vacuolar protein sorting-associated protein 11-like protein [Morus notabilis]
MYQWRKFEFFEEKLAGKCAIPEEVEGKIECCSSGRGKVVVGCHNGAVSLLDRGLNFNFSFHAHSSSVLFLQQLKQRNFLVTVGEDEQLSPQQSATCLKVFDLDRMQSEGSSSVSPDCIGILRIFTNQFPKAKITSFLVLEEAPPILLIAIGLDNGCIYCIKGDIARERITRFKLQVDNASDKSQSSIVGLGFRVDGQALQLFAVTPTSVNLFSLQSQPAKRQTLDEIGSVVNSVAMSDRSELIVGRPEAVYFYDVDGRGPCWAFEGEKKFLGWFRGYLLCVIADQRNGKNTFNVYDLKNRLIAHSLVVNEVSHMLCEWGNIILIMADKSALCIGEKDMESKLDMLFKKNLYTVAINIVQSQQADAAATAEVLRKYGDHLYSKQDYDEAMAQYIHTIGHLEPSYVIQKFLDAQRIYNLTNYLEKLHEKGLASKDHTTLLLNCYTKLKDVEKLNVFIKSEDGAGEHKFDVETAIRVCRAANYHEHAMYVAKKAGRHELYLKILLEDLGRYDEALEYISSLEPSQAGVTIKEYGKILIAHKPVETIEILMRLCTEDGESAKEGASNVTYLSMLPSPVDFLNIFIHHPESLMDFLEKYTNKVKDSPAQVEIHNTLLELYLSRDFDFPSISQANNGVDLNLVVREGVPVQSRPESNGKVIADGKDLTKEKDCLERHKKGLQLLKNAWPPELEHPLYDVGLAIILCEMNAFRDGLLYLYEKMKLYKEVIACYMQAHDHEGLIACCKRLGDSGKGGDPSLWADLLKYFGELGEDCSKAVKEVLTYIERDDILPPIIVLQTLSRNPCLTISVIKDYIARKLEQESKLIEEDRRAIDKYQVSAYSFNCSCKL